MTSDTVATKKYFLLFHSDMLDHYLESCFIKLRNLWVEWGHEYECGPFLYAACLLLHCPIHILWDRLHHRKGDLVIIGMPEVTLYDDGTTVFCLWWVKGEAECLFLSPKIGQDSSSVLCLIIIFPYHCCFLVLYFVFLALSRTDKVGNYHIIIL